mgnify:CR=1 FL=1
MTVSSTVELLVKAAQPVNALRQVRKEANKTNESFKKTEDVLKRVTAASNKVRISIQAQQKSLPKLSKVQGVLSAKVRNSEQAMRSQIKALRDLQVVVKFNGSLYNRLGAEIQKYETKLKSANGTAGQATQRNRGLAAGLGKLAVAFGIARAGQQALQAGIQRDESERRLKLLTQRFGETAEAQQAAQRAAEKFNLSQTEANTQLSRLIARLRPMGLSMQTIETAFAGFNTATILAGATASESAGAFLQLSQALGSGVLRGQELNSILEQAPLIAQAIATEMGSTVGALKKFGEEGEITSEIVIAALGRVEREGADQLAEALLGPAAAIKKFQNATEEVQVALTQDIIPEMAKSFRELAELIENLGPLLRFVGGAVGGTIGGVNRGFEESQSLFRALTQPGTVSARADIQEGRVPFNVGGAQELIGKDRLQELREIADIAVRFGGRFEGPGSQSKVLVELLQKEIGMFKAPGQPGPSDKPKTPINLDLEKERAALLKKQQETFAKFMFDKEREQLLIEAQTPEQRAQLELAMKKFDLNRQFPDMSEKELALARQQLQINFDSQVAADERTKKEKDAAKAKKDAQDAEAQRLDALKQKQIEIAQAIQNQVVGAIESAINGSKSLAESFSGLLKQLAMMIIRQKVIGSFQSLGGGGLLGLIPGFATGGRPPVGRPSIVGERGPELFVPGRSGTIVPNHELGGGGSTSVVVNVDASGTNVEGDEGSSRQLGALVGAAVQNELIKQQRPGGLLSR